MSDTSDRYWAAEPFVVHVAATASLAVQLAQEARRAGAGVIRLDLSAVQDRIALGQALAEVFMFPHKTSDLDAAIDLISDLEWFGNASGYLVIVDAADAVGREVLDDFAGIWHSGVVSAFVLLLVRGGQVDEVTGRLLRSLFERRNQADSSPMDVPAEEADAAIRDAERVVSAVEAWLTQRG